MTSLTIHARFMGPAGSGNGGYVCGRLASYVDGATSPVAVSLRRPPPLETRLSVVQRSSGVSLLDGEYLVAEARPAACTGIPPEAVTLDAARAAEPAYRGLVGHPFPTCFVCGTARAVGDGLRLSPGAHEIGRTACVWTPDPSLDDDATGYAAPEFVWSALDCPGGWTSDLEARPVVLGTMTAVCEYRVTIGREYVVVGQLLGEEGRKTFTATALYDESGRRLARAEHVWVAVDAAAFQQPTAIGKP